MIHVLDRCSSPWTNEPRPSSPALAGGMAAKPLASARVLVVDDEGLIRWSLKETLQEAGCQVIEAADGRSARAAWMAEGTFDLVLLDLRLPDADGLELLSEVRKRSPATGVIIMTAYGTPERLQAALEAGALRVISKPFDMERIRHVAAEALAAPR